MVCSNEVIVASAAVGAFPALEGKGEGRRFEERVGRGKSIRKILLGQSVCASKPSTHTRRHVR